MTAKWNLNLEKQKLSEKILLQLSDCVDFAFSYRLKKAFGISGRTIRDFIKTSDKKIGESVADLRKYKFIERKENYDGSVVISLTEKGKLRALNIRFRKLSGRHEPWDGKWRMIAFDIPDDHRKGRDALRYRMQSGGFHELQESLFLYPYDCEKEIRDFINLFKLEKYVRFAVLESVDNEDYFKKVFKL